MVLLIYSHMVQTTFHDNTQTCPFKNAKCKMHYLNKYTVICKHFHLKMHHGLSLSTGPTEDRSKMAHLEIDHCIKN